MGLTNWLTNEQTGVNQREAFASNNFLLGQSREKVHTLSWRVSDFNFFGFIPWIGDSLALKSQKKSSGARFWRFRAKKWPNSTFLGPILKFLLLVIFLQFWPHPGPIWMETLCFTRGLAWFGSKNRQTAKFGKNAKITKSGIEEKMPLLFMIS